MIISINKYDNSVGITHIKTDFELYSNNDVMIDKCYESTEFLNKWITKYYIPIGVTYSYRYRRWFYDGVEVTCGDWVDKIPITGEEEVTDILFSGETIIDSPTIYIDKERMLDPDIDSFTIRSSKFRGTGVDGHGYSHVIITDNYLNVIFKKLYIKDNMLEYVIPKNLVNVLNYDTINIFVIHGTSSGIEGKAGCITINTKTINFKIISNITRIQPRTKLPIIFKAINPQLPMGITGIEIYGKTTDAPIYITTYNEDASGVLTIPDYIFDANLNYVMKVYSTRHIQNDTVSIFHLKTLPKTPSIYLDLNVSYDKRIAVFDNVNPFHTYISGLTTCELGNGLIPIVKPSSNKISKFTYDREQLKLVDLNSYFDGIDLLSNVQSNILIKPISNDILLIDMLDANGVPTFVVYEYNGYSDRYVYMHQSTRDTEIECLGKTNALVTITNSEVYYIPTNSNVIKSYNFITNTISTVSIIPMTLSNGIMIRLANAKLLIIGGNNDKSVVFDINTSQLLFGYNVPDIFKNKPLKSICLINGDYIIFRTIDNIDHTDNTMLWYDRFANKLDVIKPEYDGEFYPELTVSLTTKELILYDNVPNGATAVAVK